MTPVKKFLNGPYVTYSLLTLQIGLFLLNYLFPSTQYFGVMNGPLIAVAKQYWRLVTPIFIHFGLTHILFNSVVLYYMGQQLEAIYGHARFLLIYLLSGVLGNIVSFAFNPSYVHSAGASTALFGMFGAFVAMAMHFKHYPMMQSMMKQYLLLIIMNLALGLFSASIDLFGHIGGLLGGFCLGQAIALKQQPMFYKKSVQLLFGLLFLFLCIICLFYGFKKYQILV